MKIKENFPSLLRCRLWHTTSPARYEMIIGTGYILPEPQISEQERWGTSQGPEFYPYVRSLGGVSLFDFEAFNPKNYNKKYIASWGEFVPYRRAWGQSIWIEINRQAIIENFISASNLLKRWKKDEAYKHNVMPMIEAAHIGPIPLTAVTCVLKYDGDAEDFEVLSC